MKIEPRGRYPAEKESELSVTRRDFVRNSFEIVGAPFAAGRREPVLRVGDVLANRRRDGDLGFLKTGTQYSIYWSLPYLENKKPVIFFDAYNPLAEYIGYRDLRDYASEESAGPSYWEVFKPPRRVERVREEMERHVLRYNTFRGINLGSAAAGIGAGLFSIHNGLGFDHIMPHIPILMTYAVWRSAKGMEEEKALIEESSADIFVTMERERLRYLQERNRQGWG